MEALATVAAAAGWPTVFAPRFCAPCRALRRDERHKATPGPDLALVCVDCSAPFVVTASERDDLTARGHALRRRCEPCVLARSAAKNAGWSSTRPRAC
jgi:hypothetical protein